MAVIRHRRKSRITKNPFCGPDQLSPFKTEASLLVTEAYVFPAVAERARNFFNVGIEPALHGIDPPDTALALQPVQHAGVRFAMQSPEAIIGVGVTIESQHLILVKVLMQVDDVAEKQENTDSV